MATVRPMAWRIRAAVLAGALTLLASAATAQSPFGRSEAPDDAPAVIEAGAIDYDSRQEIVTATGGVSIVQGERALSAREIQYFVREDRVVAIGDVTLLEPGGEVVTADRAELSDGLKRAVADRLGLRLADGSLLVGREVNRVAGAKTVLRDGVFSPCEACAEHPERPRLWRLRARKVEHDEVARDINYEDVTLEIAGAPVAYLPYFSHPDPTVERRSGVLAPTLFFGGEFEAVAQTPYYWSLGPDEDLTFKPYFTIKSAPVAAFDYRRLYESGRIDFDASLGMLDRTDLAGDKAADKVRGHAFLGGEFALDDTWRLKFDGRVASDDSYLETFSIEDDDVLRSQLAVEGFWRESYVRVGAFAAQDLREFADQNDTPIALPEATARLVGAPTPYGYAFADLDARALERESGTDSQSASAKLGWRAPIITDGGQRFDLEASLRGDAYNIRNGQAVGAGGADNVYRADPRAVVGWRFPVVQRNSWGSLILEPRVQAVAALDDVDNDDVPNEDSRAVEFDESNFFEPDRFPGRDLIDDGQRVDYGLTATTALFNGGVFSGFVGQSYAFTPGAFYAASGMNGRASDIVTAVNLAPAPWLDFAWRTRLDRSELDVRRNEVSIGAGTERARVSVAYVEIDSEAQGPEISQPAHQARLSAAIGLTEHWRIRGAHHRDIADNKSLLWSAGLTYRDECISVDLGYVRDFVSQADGGGSEDKVLLKINFKHLGGLNLSQGFGVRDAAGDEN